MEKRRGKMVEGGKPAETSPFIRALSTHINTTIIKYYYFYIEIVCYLKNTSYVCIEE